MHSSHAMKSLCQIFCTDTHHFVYLSMYFLRTAVFHAVLLWKAGKSDIPKVHESLPYFLPHWTLIHLAVDVEELLRVAAVFRPGCRHLQLPVVWIPAQMHSYRPVRPFVSAQISLQMQNPAPTVPFGSPSSGKIGPVGNHVARQVPVTVPISRWSGEGFAKDVLQVISVVSTHPVMVGFPWSSK